MKRILMEIGDRGDEEILRKAEDSLVKQELNIGKLAQHTQVQEYEEESLVEEFEFSEWDRRVMWEGRWIVNFIILIGTVLFLYRIRKNCLRY